MCKNKHCFIVVFDRNIPSGGLLLYVFVPLEAHTLLMVLPFWSIFIFYTKASNRL